MLTRPIAGVNNAVLAVTADGPLGDNVRAWAVVRRSNGEDVIAEAAIRPASMSKLQAPISGLPEGQHSVELSVTVNGDIVWRETDKLVKRLAPPDGVRIVQVDRYQRAKTPDDAANRAAVRDYLNQIHAAGKYTFSAWLKGNRPVRVWMMVGWEKFVPVEVGTEWKRYEITVDRGAAGNSFVRIYLMQQGTLWVDAVRLGKGSSR